MAAAAAAASGAGAGARKPGSPRDSESEVWSRRVRELVSSEPASRLCFECGQRGVTYVDITIGSFVCTACSGALRGLNPPHRVKSISMTTFTEGEVQFLQSRGNEACRKIWLGSFDSRASLLPDSQDPQKVKEFLQEKYEKKRWYVSPDQAKSLASSSVQSSPAEAKTLLGESAAKAPRLELLAKKMIQVSEKAPPQAAQPAKKASTDLLADIGGDPFAAPQPGPTFPAFGGQVPARTAFPSFDAFGGSPAGLTFGDPLASSQSPFQSQPVAAGGAHVAAFPASPASQPGVGIPSLGGAFRVGGIPSSVFGTLSQSPVLPPSSPAAAFGVPTCTNPFAAPAATQPALPSTNPFQTNGLAPGTFMVGSPGGFSASPSLALLLPHCNRSRCSSPHKELWVSRTMAGPPSVGFLQPEMDRGRSDPGWLFHQPFCEPNGRSTFTPLPWQSIPHQPFLLAPASRVGGDPQPASGVHSRASAPRNGGPASEETKGNV